MARLPRERFTIAGDDLAPDFDLAISGFNAGKSTQLFDAIRPLVAALTFEEDEEMASILELTLINQADISPGRTDLRAVIDSKAFQEGNSIDLYIGYGGLRHFVGRTDIVKWLPKFGADGPLTFSVKGYDGRHRMTRGNQFKIKKTTSKKRRTSYQDLPDEQIVKKVAQKYGYGVDADSTITKLHSRVSSSGKKQTKFPTRVQPSGMSDWEFLQKLASINRFDLWVDFDNTRNRYRVNFKRRADAGSADFVFSYNAADGSLISAEPDFSIHEEPTDVEVLYFDKTRRKFERTVISDLQKEEDVTLRSARQGRFTARKAITKGSRVRFAAFGQVIEAIADKPFRSRSDAETFVSQWLAEREREFLTLQATVIGIETLKPRQVHLFEGLGRRLDGFYRLTQVKHTLTPGQPYTCDLVAHKVLSQDVAVKKAAKAQTQTVIAGRSFSSTGG